MSDTIAEIAEVHPSADEVQPVRDLCERGLFLQAHEAALRIGPLSAWRGPARLLAGRLALQLGAPQLAGWHRLRAYREQPDDPEARYYLVRRVLGTRGPLAAWNRLRRMGMPADTDPQERSRWLTLHADVLGCLRDFDAAEACLAEADRLTPHKPSVLLERAELLARQDRHEEALALGREAMARQPWYPPAVIGTAGMLSHLERDEEAIALLSEAAGHLESAGVWAELAGLQLELERFTEAERSLDEYVRCSPLMEPNVAAWLAGRRADAAHGTRDFTRELEWARQAKGTFWKTVAERLEQHAADPPPRKVLPVGFVWQHYQTCAPATLTVLARFWSLPAEHLELAERITYDGTPSHAQRRWAEGNNLCAREFTVSRDNARALVERDVPFALATAVPGGGHLQAVVGFDALRDTLFLRDPSRRYLNEVLTDPFLDAYRSTGPRGLVLVPRERAPLLEEVPLLDAPLYDRLHELRCALDEHDRPRAVACLEAMRVEAPEHRLTLEARRQIAQYDGNPAELLDVLTALLKLFPDDTMLEISSVECLRDLGRGEERLALVKKMCARPQPDSIALQFHARELMLDARQWRSARLLLEQAIRRSPRHAAHYLYLGNLLWDEREFDDAFMLYRFAACLDDKGEGFARVYFRAARCLGRTEEALTFLWQRFQRFGRKSGLPARTLARSLADLDRDEEGLAVLDEALRLRPDDGELLLAAADLCREQGKFARAEELVGAARGRSHPCAWLRHAAELAGSRGRLEEARQHWEQLLAADPLALDAHRSLVQLLAGSQGRPAALEHLRQACDRFPHHFELTRLWNEWLRDEDPAGGEVVVRRLLASHPLSAWGHRELAVHLARQGRCDEALTVLEEAGRLEPTAAALHSVRGFVLVRAGRSAEAKDAYRQALALDVDFDGPLNAWLRLCDSLAERREVLAFVESELVRQVTFGQGLFAFQQAARRTLKPEETLATLRRGLEARPDLWQAWSAVTDQLSDMHLLDEALPHATQATERFPLVATLWLDLAHVCHLRHEDEGEISGLKRALEINPSWGKPQRLLANCYERLGRFDEAHAVLERAVLLAPLAESNHFALADILWKMRRREEAVARLQHSLMIEPVSDSAWDRLFDWARELRQPERAIDFARRMTERRPGEPRLWMALGKALALVDSQLPEALAALDRAVALNPHLVDAHERRAELLCRAKRFDEARAACQPSAWNGRPPLSLRLRLAIILGEEKKYPDAKTVVREVLAEDPNSYTAWAYLADWTEATRSWDEHHEATEHMVRLAPHHSTAYGYRAASRLRRGDRNGAKFDLRHALHLQPNYSWAALELFDAHLRDNELREATRVLRHARRYRRTEFTQARACQLAARRGRQGPALRVLRRLCLSDHAGSWPLEAARDACVDARWEAEVARVFTAVLDDPRCRPQVAVLWGRLDPPLPTKEMLPHLPRALELIDRAIEASPGTFLPHDVKAELLSRAGRHAEAEAACGHPAQAQSPYLRGRLAWVCAQAGDLARAVETMKSAVAEDADYDWGWRQLAEWTDKLKDWPLNLQATENMVRLRPKSATSYGYRGDARLQTGDKPGALADFREAVRLSPGYIYAWRQLFELSLEAGDLDECGRCVEAVRQTRDDEFTWRQAGQLAVARKNKEEAVGFLRRIALSSHPSPWPLQELHDSFTKAGWRETLRVCYDELLPEDNCRPQVAELWVDLLPMSQLGEDPELAARAHRLFDLAIAERPKELRAYDLKALLYVAEKRFDEAEAICRVPAVAGAVGIRSRLAWVLRKRGLYTRAVTIWRGCVEESPNSGWSFYNLMDSLGEIDAWTQRRWAADNYIRIYPQRMQGYRQRGHARRDLGDKQGAKEDYRRGLDLDPTDAASVLYLFDLLLDMGERDEAAEVLTELPEKTHLAYRLSAEGRLAARRGLQDEALEKLRQLCTTEDDGDTWVLDDVMKVLKTCGWDRAIEEVFEQAHGSEHVLPNTGEHWLELRAARDAWLSPEEIDAWAGRGQPGCSVLVGQAMALARAGRGPELLALLGKHGERLREKTCFWARVGRALFRAVEFRAAADWLADWASREKLTASPLCDLGLSLRVLGRWDEAHTVQIHAQTLKGDTTTGMQEMWLGLDAALAGNVDEARQCLEILAGGKLDDEPPYAWLRLLIQAIVDAAEQSPEQRTRAFEELQTCLPGVGATKDGVRLQPVLAAALEHAGE